MFVDTCGCECEEYQTAKGLGSKGNVREVVIVNKIISSLIQSGLSEKTIGIITPYALQVKYKQIFHNYFIAEMLFKLF